MIMKRILIVLIAVMVFTSMAAQSARAEGLLTDLVDMVKKWFESSPFGNIFSMPVKRMENIDLIFSPEKFELDVQEPVNVSSDRTEITAFTGHVDIDLGSEESFLTLTESESPLKVRIESASVAIIGLKVGSLDLQNMNLLMKSGNWNETAENGSVTIKDFLGDCIIENGKIELKGNISKLLKS